jgi:hypothetical protein
MLNGLVAAQRAWQRGLVVSRSIRGQEIYADLIVGLPVKVGARPGSHLWLLLSPVSSFCR